MHNKLILAYGNSAYSEKSQQVGRDSDLGQLLLALRQAQKETKAPLVCAKHLGINVSAFSVNLNYTKEKLAFQSVFINPTTLRTKAPLVSGLESDIAIPKLVVSVARPKVVEISFFDDEFNQRSEAFTDLAARWILHGIDHTNGITIIDRINEHRQRSVKGQLRRIMSGKVDVGYELKFATNT